MRQRKWYASKKLQAALLLTTGLGVYFETFKPLGIRYVQGKSMEPSVHDGDYVFSECFPFLNSRVHLHDLVIFHDPTSELILFKRVTALPGQHFFHHHLESPIPEDTYFLQGDNRADSYDSTSFGTAPIEERVLFLYCPHRREVKTQFPLPK